MRAFRRAKTACRLCNKFAGLQRALNGISFARSFRYVRGDFGYLNVLRRHHVWLLVVFVRSSRDGIKIPRHAMVLLLLRRRSLVVTVIAAAAVISGSGVRHLPYT